MPIVIVRPFSVYGPRLRPDLALSIFARAILSGRPLPLFGDGSIRRDFTHVDDLCDGLEAALDREAVVGEAFNLGHDRPIEVREVIARLEALLGRRADIRREPEKPGEMPVTHADLSKARRRLGYEPRTSFDAGLPTFVDWFRRRYEHAAGASAAASSAAASVASAGAASGAAASSAAGAAGAGVVPPHAATSMLSSTNRDSSVNSPLRILVTPLVRLKQLASIQLDLK